MPSRLPPPDFLTASPPPDLSNPLNQRQRHSAFIPPLAAASVSLALLVFFAIIYLKFYRKLTAHTDLKPLRKFSYSVLRRATSSFAVVNRLGQGGFGSVYRGTLPSGQEIAVKLMDPSGSLQGEREFQNELTISSRIDTTCCPYVVSVLGFSSDDSRTQRRRRRRLIVYEYMHNGSLQDALLDRKCPELMEWKRRFRIVLSVAKGVEYLHCICEPPIVHGDIKPSNVLLDDNFNAKIADFGLAQVLTRDDIIETFYECCEDLEENGKGKTSPEVGGGNGEENGSIIEETCSAMTEEVILNVNLNQSPEISCFKILDGETLTSLSPDTSALMASPPEGLEKSSVSEGCFDRSSVDSGNRRVTGKKKCLSGRVWWWKQDNGCRGSDSGRVKDYVMDWIGSEVKKERPKKVWIAASSSVEASGPVVQKKPKKKLEWWASLEEERIQKEKKHKTPREWWKEEFCDELTKKKKRALKSDNGTEFWWQRDDDLVPERKRRKSRGSIDWWLDSFSGEFRYGRRNSQEWASGDIPKSGGVSSTPSMRGTVCYIAPECGVGGQFSEKCDVYSFGVLLLVVVSGRRPLQVMASPISEFERANLVSWARQLSHNGRLLDLVDPNIQSLDRDQALLCITIALLCLQRSPSKRLTMKEIVGMLSGQAEPAQLPFEFSPSPPSNFTFKSHEKPL